MHLSFAVFRGIGARSAPPPRGGAARRMENRRDIHGERRNRAAGGVLRVAWAETLALRNTVCGNREQLPLVPQRPPSSNPHFSPTARCAFSLVRPPLPVPYSPRPGRRTVLPTGGEHHRPGKLFLQLVFRFCKRRRTRNHYIHRRNKTPCERCATARAFQCFVSGSSDPRVRHEESRAFFVDCQDNQRKNKEIEDE